MVDAADIISDEGVYLEEPDKMAAFKMLQG